MKKGGRSLDLTYWYETKMKCQKQRSDPYPCFLIPIDPLTIRNGGFFIGGCHILGRYRAALVVIERIGLS